MEACALADVTPLLLNAGSAGLVWRRLRDTDLRESSAARSLKEAFHQTILNAAILDGEIGAAITTLRSAGIEPLIGKGWAVARLYPEVGLRPYGDIDLYVDPSQYERTLKLLEEFTDSSCWVDLHCGPDILEERTFSRLLDRSESVLLDGVPVRVFSTEDHLRLLCFHALRHGAWRSLWFCDIAVALESRPDGFDWDYLLRGDRIRENWVACAIILAHQLLGARIDDTPLANRTETLPGWMAPEMVSQWGGEYRAHGRRRPIASCLNDPRGMMKEIVRRWPNAIEATVGLGRRFSDSVTLPLKLVSYLARGAEVVRGLARANDSRNGRGQQHTL